MSASENLSVTIIQSSLHWEDPEANRKRFAKKIGEIKKKTHLIILPEMFTTGFSMNAEALSEETEGVTLQWMKEQARLYNSAITGSIIVEEHSLFYNRLFFVFPNGTYVTYDKKHTFTLAGEHKTFASGKERIIVEYEGWKICPLICYDLRFPVWARNTQAYDILLYTANWPSKRVNAWDALLKARAIENMSYCIGVNRVGIDGNGHAYTGHSAVYDVLGTHISTKNFEQEFTETIVLNKKQLEDHRKHLQFLRDQDHFTLV